MHKGNAVVEELLPNVAQFCWYNLIYSRDFADRALSATGYASICLPHGHSCAIKILFVTWGWGTERRTQGCERSGMLKFPLAAGQKWCQSSLSIILLCHPSLLCVSGPAISLLLWFWEWKIGYYLLSKLVWLSVPNILVKVENLVLIKGQPALPILWLLSMLL